jgi:hypothetical protein
MKELRPKGQMPFMVRDHERTSFENNQFKSESRKSKNPDILPLHSAREVWYICKVAPQGNISK